MGQNESSRITKRSAFLFAHHRSIANTVIDQSLDTPNSSPQLNALEDDSATTGTGEEQAQVLKQMQPDFILDEDADADARKDKIEESERRENGDSSITLMGRLISQLPWAQ